MLTLNTTQNSGMRYAMDQLQPSITPDLARVVELKAAATQEVLAFLKMRPVHTVVMASFIADNGIESTLNRGKFYGYRGTDGSLEGVALIGHSTLVEARTEAALTALALTRTLVRDPDPPDHVQWRRGPDLLEPLHRRANRAEAHLHRTSVRAQLPFSSPEM